VFIQVFVPKKSNYKIYFKISKIKGLRKRLRCLVYKHKFPELQDEIKHELTAGIQACIDVKNSDKFQKLLEFLLLVGNFMNSGSQNLERSHGFDMKFLPKFYQTKCNDQKRTLLHLVAQLVNDKNPSILDFTNDFKAFIEQASRSILNLNGGLSSAHQIESFFNKSVS
jgi:diaphanous 2